MGKPQPDFVVPSVGEYVTFIEVHCKGGEWLFRGQPCDKPLLPKVFRPEYWDNEDYDAEKHNIEGEMFGAFKRAVVRFLDRTPPDDRSLEWLAIAQHHFLPTRLLDWSGSALAALWFAVSGDEASCGDAAVEAAVPRPSEPRRSPRRSVGVVWACLPAKDDYLDLDDGSREAARAPFDIRKTWFFRPMQYTERIVAQDGRFSLHPDREKDRQEAERRGGTAEDFAPVPFEDNGRYNEDSPEYQKREEDGEPVGRLLKIEAPASSWGDLRCGLDRLGVNQATVYPDLDGLCGHLAWEAQQKNRARSG